MAGFHSDIEKKREKALLNLKSLGKENHKRAWKRVKVKIYLDDLKTNRRYYASKYEITES